MLDELRELYQEVILDHGRNPRNHRHPEDANRRAHGNNPICGDTLVVYLAIGEDGVIRDFFLSCPQICRARISALSA